MCFHVCVWITTIEGARGWRVGEELLVWVLGSVSIILLLCIRTPTQGSRDSLKVQVSAGCYLPSVTRDIMIRGAFVKRVGGAHWVDDFLFIDWFSFFSLKVQCLPDHRDLEKSSFFHHYWMTKCYSWFRVLYTLPIKKPSIRSKEKKVRVKWSFVWNCHLLLGVDFPFPDPSATHHVDFK